MLGSISPTCPRKDPQPVAMDRESPGMCFDPTKKDGSWKTRLLSDEPLGLLSYPVEGPVHIGCNRMSPEMSVAGRDQRAWKKGNRQSLLDMFVCKFKSWTWSDTSTDCTESEDRMVHDHHYSRNLLFGGGGADKCLEGGIMSSSAKELLLGEEEEEEQVESESTDCRCCSSHRYFSDSREGGEPDRAVIKTTEKRRLMMKRFVSLVAVLSSFLFLLVILLEQSYVRPDHKSSEAQYLASRIKRLPHCIIIGARKCGTRALIDMLNLHPQVEKAALEVHFFDRDDNYAKGLEWYREHMPECREDQIGIEKSPSYFITPEVPERIHAMNSSIKLLLIVREPVTRVISDYTQIYGTNAKTHNGSSKSPRLEELVLQADGSINVQYKAIRISLYSRYLQRWLDVFPSTQIHVIDGDALIRDPYSQLRDVERFLELEPRLQRDNFYFNSTKGFYCWRKLSGDVRNNETGLHCLNDSKGRRHPPVDRYIVSRLRQFYNPHNLKFYDMVGRDFGWPEK